MSYLNAKIARARSPVARYGVPRPRSMWSPLGSTDAPNPTCDAAGHSAQAYYDQQLQTVTSTWKQTDGFYYVQDMLDIVSKGLTFQQAGQKLLDQLSSTYGEFGQDSLKQARDQAQNDLFDVGKNALDFLNAAHAAQSSGATVVDAQGLKEWVIDAISAAGYAAFVAAYVQCAMPTGAALIIAAAAFFDAAGKAFLAVIVKSAKVVYNAANIVYKTTVATLDLAATVVKYAPYIAGAYGLAWLWKNYGQKLKR